MTMLTETLPPIAVEVETFPAGEYEGYYTWYPGTVVEVSPTGEAVISPTGENTQETYVVTFDQVEGVTLMPGADLELMYKQPTIWDNTWFVGGLMTLGVVLILAVIQVLLRGKKNKDAKQYAKLLEPVTPAAPVVTAEGDPVKTPVAGVVTKVNVTPGQKVEKGQLLCVMETRLTATESGVVTQVSIPEGTIVGSGTSMFVIKKENGS